MKFSIKIFILSVIMQSCIAQSNSYLTQIKQNKVMIKEPYYQIQFDAAACLFEIRVNDIPILTMNLRGQASTGYPINNAISNTGLQEVTIKLLPLEGTTQLSEKAYLNYHIKLFDTYQGFKLVDRFEGFESKPVEKDQILPLIQGKSTFEAEVPYTLRDLWKQGKNIKDIEDYTVKIKNAYKRIANIIVEGKYDLFREKMEDREYNMATSMYLSATESKNRLDQMIEAFKNGYNHVLFDENSVPILSAYGKKVSLKSLNGEPALSFGNKEENETDHARYRILL